MGREAELAHGRVGMLAATGFLVQEKFHPLFSGDGGPAIDQFAKLPVIMWPASSRRRPSRTRPGAPTGVCPTCRATSTTRGISSTGRARLRTPQSRDAHTIVYRSN